MAFFETRSENAVSASLHFSTVYGSADLLALPVRGRTPRHFRRRKSLTMKEPGNRPMTEQARLRLIFGQDAQ
jgi:hypothetical protein